MLTLKRLAIAGAALALAVGLAGCLSLRGDITLDRQGRASGQTILEINKQLATMGGITSADELRDKAKSNGSDIQVEDTGDTYKMTLNWDHGALAQDKFMSTSIDQGGKLNFTLLMGDQSATTEDSSLFGDMNLGAVDLTVHFPGRVLSTSGPGIQQTDDRTVRINTPLTTSNMNSTWTASSAIDPPKPASQRYLPIIIVAGVVMLGGGGGVLVLWRRHRRQPASATTTSPDELVGQ